MASRARIPIDGLSRCLCPAIDSFLPPRSFHTPGAGRKRTHTQHQTRAVHTNPPENPPNSSTPNPKLNPKPKHPICTVDLDNHTQRGFSSALATAPLGALYKTLHDARNSEGQARRIRLLVRWLVERRRQRPNVMLYEALVVANWATLGSAGEVKGLWEEMRRVGLQATGRFYYAVLRALAVHPNYLLRNEILREMEKTPRDGDEVEGQVNGQKRESGVLPEGRCSVALGLLRDGQYEMALDYFDDIVSSGVDFPAWVWDVFIFVLANRGFVEDAVQLMMRRSGTTVKSAAVSPYTLWYFLLGECSSLHRYPETKFIWTELVETNLINPSDGIALNVLNLAARHGDVNLASHALETLSARVKLSIHHYEAMIECYTQSGDLNNAFRILCIMPTAGIIPEAGSTRSIFAILKNSPCQTDTFVTLLSEHRAAQTNIPIAAANAALEALCYQKRFDRAAAFYQDITHLCNEGPKHHTLKLLLDSATTTEHARFVLTQLDTSAIRQRPDMYPGIIRCRLLAGDRDACLRYFEMGPAMRLENLSWLDKTTLLAVIRSFVADQDPRTWDLVGLGRRLGMEINEEVEVMMEVMRRQEAEREMVEMATGAADVSSSSPA